MPESRNAKSRPKVYEGIVEKLSVQIRGGTPPLGAKLPSVREFGRHLGVTPTTVTRAYWALEGEGLIEARPQSGFFVSYSKENRPSTHWEGEEKNPRPIGKGPLSAQINFLPYIFQQMVNPKNLFLSLGFPGLSVFPSKDFQRSVGLGRAKLGAKGLEYNWPNGYQPLLQQISKEYFNCGVEIRPDNLLLTTGVSEGINIALRALTRPGDIIAVESPVFPMWAVVAQNCGLRIIEIPIDSESGMNLDYLERAIQKNRVSAVIAMPNFHHPTTYCMPDAAKARLVSILEKKDIPLIENDIYSELYFGTRRPKPAKAFDRTGNVVLLSSFSKILAPGLRVGWMAAGKYMKELSGQKFVGNASTNPVTEAGVSDFIARGLYKRHMKKVRSFCAENFKRFEAEAISRHFPEGTRITRPNGGCLCWIELPDHVNALRLHYDALKRNILIFPGNIFSLKPRHLNFLSLSFGMVWSDSIEAAFKEVGDLAKEQLRFRN